MPVPENPKIYHIVHVDRLPSIIKYGCLWSDSEANRRNLSGTTVGMSRIKNRRLDELTLTSHPHLHVGDCVPFYFCPRSVMLYLLYRGNHPELEYRGGQLPIIHLESDLYKAISWAQKNEKRWAFTKTNAGSRYFEDFNDISDLNQIDWDAVSTNDWKNCREEKQAEFLIEHSFPFSLVNRIGVQYGTIRVQVQEALRSLPVRPIVEIKRDWYY